MVNFRHRTKGKGKRWKKGHSSSSNPETKKYRDVAKCRFFQDNAGEGNLTSEALKKHNAILGERNDAREVRMEDEDDDQTYDGTLKTFKTFASNWSNCSNVSFNRLLNGFRSDSAIHKEMLAILAAVTEVIKTNGGKETSVEYLGALMTTLDVCESEESLTALLQLLGMVIKNIPESLLRLKYAEMSKTFIDNLGKFSEAENPGILRSLIGCLSVLLRAQESAVWSNSSTIQAMDSILAFTTHSKPKVRKAAQHAVCAILKGSCFMLGEDRLEQHPAAPHVAKYLIRQIESGRSLGGATTTLHILAFFKEVLCTFPKVQLKGACESILKVMTLGNMLITSCGMQALHSLFISRPPTTSLTPQLNAQLIAALFDYQPAPTDTQPTLAWLAVMQEAYINLAKSDLGLCFGNLLRLFTAVTQLLLSDKPEVMNGATLTLKAVTEDCVAPACTKELVNTYKHTLSILFKTIESGLTYKFHAVWQHILHILAVWFKVGGEQCKDFMIPCLKQLGELRDSYKFSNVNELEFAVGEAIRSLGPEIVLKAIPLHITGEEKNHEFKRSWLLPILKQNICSNRLQFFIQYFLPIATLCKKQSATLSAQNDQIGAHSYDLLQSQTWSLLPCFCNNPTDLKDNFKQVAKIIGAAIGEYKELRLDAMAALRKLISSSQDAGNDGNVSEMARFAKNYLPILFNLYTTKPTGTDEEGQRLAAFETIKIYLQIADSNLCYELFDKALEKIGTEDVQPFVKESVFELLRALLPYQDISRIDRLFSSCKETLGNIKNHHEQKKAYRILEELCSTDSEGCKNFLNENLSTLQSLLIDSLSTSAVPSRGPRLRCLIHLVRKLDKTQEDVLKQIMPEAVLCCKDVNMRCRTAAYNLLVEIGQVMFRFSDKSQDFVIRDYMGMLMAGLAGTPSLASASILALARACYDFIDYIPQDLMQMILENVCLLVTTSTREIVGSSLSFIKMFLTTFSYSDVAKEVPLIVKSLVGMTDDCKRNFRVVTRNLFARLLRKFGFDVIVKLVPKSDVITHKRLNNLRKIQARKKKLRKEEQEAEEDESGGEDMFTTKAHPRSIEDILAESEESDFEEESQRSAKPKKQKKGKSKAWIEENEDDIVDFTDRAATQRITSTNPAAEKMVMVKKKSQSDFKVMSDGRLIIRDGSDDEEDNFSRKRKFDVESDSGSDLDELSKLQIGRKRKLSMSSSVSMISEPAMKYQAGGSGIHRPTKKTSGKVPKNTGAEYRAKKGDSDIKRRGKPDPYAYVPLSRNSLNRRKKKKKQGGQFKTLCRAAQKGAKKGALLRKKNASRKNRN